MEITADGSFILPMLCFAMLLLTGAVVGAWMLWDRVVKTGGYFKGFIHGFLFAEGEELPEEVLKRAYRKGENYGEEAKKED